MITGRILTILLVAAVAAGGIGGAALGDDGEFSSEGLEAVDLRKDDAQSETELVDDDLDDDPTGDDDKTRGDDGTSWGHNHDQDATGGDDGTAGGDNSSYVAPAPAAAPAPVYDDYSDGGGYAVSGS